MTSSLLLALLLAQATPPKTHARPGKVAPYSVQVQGTADGTPLPVTGSFTAAGAGDTVGVAATYNSNSDCGFVATAGQTGIGFILQAGTLAATLTPSVSVDSTDGSNGTWVATSFVDIDGNTAATLVVTNPNAATARGVKAIAGTRYAKVCTTAFTSGSTTGNLVASTPLPPPPAAGADVTDRAARLLGVLSAGNNNIGDVDIASGTVTVTDGAGALNVIVDSGALTVSDGSGALNVIVDSSALPSGASTAAKQPALGTAGTASTDVLSVQGIASMTPLLVGDGTGALNVIVDSGAVTATVTDGAGALNTIVDSITAGDNDIGNVDLELAGTAASTGNGASGAQTLRVTVASDSTGTIKINDGTDTALVSGSGALTVTCDNCGGSTFADDDAFTPGTTPVLIIGGEVDDTGTTAATENSAAAPRITPQRSLHMNLRNNAGTEVGTSGAALRIDPTGATAQPVTDNGGSLTVDGTVTVTDGSGALNVIVDSSASLTVTDGAGAMNVIVDSITAGNNNIGDVDVASITAGDNDIGNVDLEFAGTAAATNNGTASAQTMRVTVASDSTGTTIATQATAANLNVRADTSGATAAAPPARANFVGGLGSGATGGFLTGLTVCDSHIPVDIVTATTTLVVTGVSGRHVRICSVNLVTAGANNVAIITGTGATCGTSTAGVNGGVTAAEGWNLAANGGIAQGGGLGEIMRSETTGDSICIITSAAVQLSGNISYAIY